MKKVLLIILAITLFPCFAIADPYQPDLCFSTYGAVDSVGGMFPGDYFSINVYMTYNLDVYIQIMVWNNNDVMTISKEGIVKSKNETPGILYFVFADGSYYTAHYEEEKTWRLWLDLEEGSICLQDSPWLNPLTDYKEDKK